MDNLSVDGIRSAERRLCTFLVPVEEVGVLRYVRKRRRHINREPLHQRERFCLLGACWARVHVFCASPKMGPVYLISAKPLFLYSEKVHMLLWSKASWATLTFHVLNLCLSRELRIWLC